MASWNDKAWESIIADYPNLEGKSETVAFTTWFLADNPDVDPQTLRDAGAKYGISVAGRAIGSARQILGIAKPTAKKKIGGKKGGRKPGRPVGSKSKSTSSFDGMSDVYKALDSLKEMERQNQRMRDSLSRIRDLIDKALG